MKELLHKSIFTIASLSIFLLVACSDDSSMENAGEELDGLANDAARATENAAESVQDAAVETGRRLEDACEELTEKNC